MTTPKLQPQSIATTGTLLRRWRFWVYSVLIAVGSLLGIVGNVASQQGGHSPSVYQVDIDGVINPGSLALLEHGIRTAESKGATALIVRIDTPGGLLSSTRDMVSAIAEAQVPVIGYVGPTGASATSAGAFILLSTHVAAMNAGTNVGASSPVSGDGGDIGGTMGKKVMNDSRAFMRGIASSRGRDADVAERFVSEAQSLTATEALANNVIDLVVPEPGQLLQAVDGREINFHGKQITLELAGAEHNEVKPRLLDRVLAVIAHPQIAHMLISLGMLAIYFEILSPGLAFPGVFGAIAVVTGLIGAQTLPLNTGFLILLFLGIGLMVAEYFVAGFGVLGIGGAVAFILGSLNLFDAPTSAESRTTILSVSIAVSGAMLVSTWLIARSLRASSRTILPLVGKRGEAMVDFDRVTGTESDGFRGHVLIDDKPWTAVSAEPLQHGDAIEVVQDNDGRYLSVKKRSE